MIACPAPPRPPCTYTSMQSPRPSHGDTAPRSQRHERGQTQPGILCGGRLLWWRPCCSTDLWSNAHLEQEENPVISTQTGSLYYVYQWQCSNTQYRVTVSSCTVATSHVHIRAHWVINYHKLLRNILPNDKLQEFYATSHSLKPEPVVT